jgi:hypothetical protein
VYRQCPTLKTTVEGVIALKDVERNAILDRLAMDVVERVFLYLLKSVAENQTCYTCTDDQHWLFHWALHRMSHVRLTPRVIKKDEF